MNTGRGTANRNMEIIKKTFIWSIFKLLACVALSMGMGAAEPLNDVDFNHEVRPILSDKCFHCHGNDEEHRKGDLRLDVRDEAIESGAITPGAPENSEMIARIFHTDPDELMPPSEAKLGTLTASEKDILQRWIRQGANYEEHWSFVPLPASVLAPKIPDASNSNWIRNEIDAFVLRLLHLKGVPPAREASRSRWLRRVSFDLTGLPPTIQELDEFLADESGENAYVKVIDRLLRSEAFGERMASDWLDAARYADTFGYQADRDMHVWPWRDWVVNALNKNLPYDKFIMHQLAGDLMDESNATMKLATTFNRLHRQTNEGGSINEEFRIEYVSNRLETAATAFLGLTIGCAKCHDHKFDPFSQRDYYQLSAFFNNIDESGLYSHFTETTPTPTLTMYEGKTKERHEQLKREISELENTLKSVATEAAVRYQEASHINFSISEPILSESFEDVKNAQRNQIVEGKSGKAIEFSGDAPFVVGDENSAAFSRTDTFSFSLWIRPSQFKARQVVFHRSRAAEDSAFRGYELMLYDGKPTFSLIHFWPGNALRVQAREKLPLNEWTHLTITYDGSSRAEGVNFYLNGHSAELNVIRDKLTRDINHRKEWGDAEVGKQKVQLAGRFRDIGFAGGIIDEFQIFDVDLSPWESAAIAGDSSHVRDEAKVLLYTLRNDTGFKNARLEIQELRKKEDALISGERQIMVMKDMPEQRKTYVLKRGQYDQPGDEVGPNTPKSLFSMDSDWSRNRLGLAKWMIDDRNPLTARVAVNRFWQALFGKGIVGTPEDFGSQGMQPTHPELLDWLV